MIRERIEQRHSAAPRGSYRTRYERVSEVERLRKARLGSERSRWKRGADANKAGRAFDHGNGWHAGPLAGAFGAVTATLAGSALASMLLARRAGANNPPLGRFVTGAGTRLHVYEQGRGTPVVMLHGLGTGLGDMLASGLVTAASRQFHVITFDRPGYGHSERPRDRVWGVHEQARAMREAIGRMGVDRPIIVGHSWGALVALAWALDAPAAVAGLVLLSGYLYPVSRTDIVPLSAPVIPVVGDILRYSVLPWVNRMTIPAMYRRMFAPQPIPGRFFDDVPISMVARPLTIRAIAEEAALMMPAAESLGQHYGDLRIPISLLAGDADQITDPHAHTERFANEVRAASARLLPGVGHMAHFTATGEVLKEIASVAGQPIRAQPVSPAVEEAAAIR